jgi:[acyl-carrier-protein] S-malonyltransferase
MAAPGQGAQRQGFLASWLELPGAAERLGQWSELAGVDLVRMGTSAGSSEITDTAVAQPLLVAAALLGAGQLSRPGIAAGHSVGELAAGALAGVLPPDAAIRLAAARGRAMAQVTSLVPTGMTAVLGGDARAIRTAIGEHGLTAANINAKDQIVVAGTRDQLKAFAATPLPGAKLRELRVAGAFHTAHMAPAVKALATAALSIPVRDPVVTVLSNRDGGVVSSGKDWVQRVIGQVARPVRWDLCLETMASLGATAFLELPPAGPLAGLARRALPGARILALKTPDQLDAAQRLIDQE